MDYTGKEPAESFLAPPLNAVVEEMDRTYPKDISASVQDGKKDDNGWPEGLSEAFNKMKNVHSEAFITSGTVQYDACVGDYAAAGFKYHGALSILNVIMSYEYLWSRIRVKGGAYGCMCGFAPAGTGYFTSYRDPNLYETYKVYEEAPEYVRNFDADERTMRKFIIGAFSNVDVPLNPPADGARSLGAFLSKTPIEFIQKNRDEMLSANVETIRSLGDIVECLTSSGLRCVVGSASKIEENKDMFEHVETLIK